VCVWTKGTCAPPPASPKCALLLLTCCCAAIIYPPTVCLILFFHQPKRAVGRESIKQFHHFAQLLLQLTRTLTVDASPVLLPKSVARRERGGGSSCCCS
jgi:hypothetical protein